MKKVYIKFGEFETEELEDIYVGLLEGDLVKVIIPEASYSYCQKLAAHWGDEKVYLVQGDEVADTENGGVVLANAYIVGELTRDEKRKGYICSEVLKWKMLHRPKRESRYQSGWRGILQRLLPFWEEATSNEEYETYEE